MATDNFKNLNVRLKQKCDTLVNWQKIWSTFVPLRGEVIVFEVPTGGTAVEGENSRPQHITKTGDGSTTLQLLPWDSALAADVYDWAKASTKPSYTASEVGAVPTTRTINNKALSGDITLTKGDVGLGNVTNESKATMFTSAALTGTPTAPTATTATYTTQIATTAFVHDVVDDFKNNVTIKNAEHATSATTATTANKVANSLTIQGNGTTAAEFNGSAEKTVNIKGSGTVSVTGNSSNGTITITGSAHPTALKNPYALQIGGKSYDGSTAISVSASDLGIEGAMHFKGAITTDPTTITTGYSNGDVVLYNGKEYVWSSNAFVELGDEGSHALKTITLTAGNGLTGGGTLAANRTFAVGAGNGITVSADAVAAKAGNGITVDATGINHANTSDVTSVNAADRTYVKSLTFDTYGHVTAVSTGTETVVNTDTGATSVDVEGTGNAVTGASYDADTRTITLTKGTTFLTSHQSVSLASGTNNGTLKLTVNGTSTDNIAVKGLGSAAYKGVVTSVSNSTNLPTSNAVKTFVEGKGYVTSSGVTSVATGTGLTGGTITTTGTINFDTTCEFVLNGGSSTVNIGVEQSQLD